MARASLRPGDFVQLAPKAGSPVTHAYGIGINQVLLLTMVLEPNVYGRRAFVVECGDRSVVVWPSQVNRRGRKRPREKETE